MIFLFHYYFLNINNYLIKLKYKFIINKKNPTYGMAGRSSQAPLPPATWLGSTYHNLIYLLLYICTAISHGNIRLVATKISKYSMDKIRSYKRQSDVRLSDIRHQRRPQTADEQARKLGFRLFCFVFRIV